MSQTGTGRPFSVIPWDGDFLTPLKNMIGAATGDRPGRAVVIFPNSRPRRYMEELYLREGRPMLLPRMITVDELLELCRAAWLHTPPLRRAEMPDLVALLRGCVARVARNRPADSPLHELDGPGGMARFLPWGIRLASLLEECAAQMVAIEDLNAADGVIPFAEALLADLRGINEEWLKAMRKAGLSARGLEAAQLARLALDDPQLPQELKDRSVFLAGFVRPTASENILFRYLWERGAYICLHSDPAVTEGGGHWACIDHREWIRGWGAGAVTACPPTGNRPDIRFFAGYDLHSQLQELGRLLEEESSSKGKEGKGNAGEERSGGTEGGRAVVLPHPSLLMPVLQHLPEQELNISLGYPLERSLLGGLIEAILRLRESMRISGKEPRWPWRNMLDLVSHPCLRMLSLPDGTALRPLLQEAERELRGGGRMVSLPRFMERLYGRIESAPELCSLWPLWQDCMNTLLASWADCSCLRDTSHRLGAVCELLLRYGESVWPSFPLDAECLFRLMKHVIPVLSDNAMAEEELPPASLFAMVRQYLAGERVPFEADPLTALQVLGTLETRLLCFDSVYVLDMTEDRIPGAPERDPLLPDNLRALLGLPDRFRRATLEAHTFHRLVAGARDVVLFWQEGANTSELLEAQKRRSRFVEEYLWRAEKQSGRLLVPGEGIFGAAGFPAVVPPAVGGAAVVRTEALDAAMEALLSTPLSPTLLDSYLHCPARFCRRYLLGLREGDSVPEGDDNAGVGNVIHNTLLRLYTPWLNRTVCRKDISVERDIMPLFREELESSGMIDRLPSESLFMLQVSAPLRFRDFLAAQPEEMKPVLLEGRLTAPLMVGGAERMLEGRLDRVDRRGDSFVVVDYKTGYVPERGKLFRAKPGDAMIALWDALPDWTPEGEDLLPALAEAVPSLQLPCYVFLGRHAYGAAADNAVWEDLGRNRKDKKNAVEIPLLDEDIPEEWRESLLEGIPALFGFVLDHMARSSSFAPREGKHCSWCPFAAMCR